MMAARKKKPTTDDDAFQIVLRSSRRVADRADALIVHVQERSGLPVTRSDVFREALLRGLKAMEREARQDE